MNSSSNASPALSRRAFIARSSVAAAATPLLGGLLVSPAARAAAAGAHDKIRVALIGSGRMGRGNLATFFKFPEVDCPVICDVDDGMLANGVELVEKQRGTRPDTVKDFRRVLDRKDVDAVLVGTPDHWHALPTVMACQAGKDVYVEKPLATSIAEGRAMLEAARKHSRVVQMGTQWRSGKHFAEAVEFVQSDWEIVSEPKKKSLEAKKHPGSEDPRPAHVRNFLDCMISRQAPVENLEVGHHVSTVAHLGNLALRTGRKLNWDHQNERVIGDSEADKLVGVDYRQPWKLPYYPRA